METLPADFPFASAQVSLAPDVVYRTFATETVILNLQTGRYHGLNKTGGRCSSCSSVPTAWRPPWRSSRAATGRSRWRSSRTCARSAGGSHERGPIEITLNGAH